MKLIFPTLNNTWLEAKKISISSSLSLIILFNSDKALPGMMTFLFSDSSSNCNFLTAKRCESVAVHINSLSCISQFTPVSTGRVSEVDTAKLVCAMIFFSTLTDN